MKKINKTKFITAISLGVFSLVPVSNAYALTDQQRLNQINGQIQNAQSNVSRAQAESRSLQSQIAALDGQIVETQNKMTETQNQIVVIEKNIAETQIQIKTAEKEMADKKAKLSEFLRVSYEGGQISIIELIAGSSSFSDFVSKKEYVDEMQLEIKQITDKLAEMKRALEEKQRKLESEKQNMEGLKVALTEQKNQLEEQKKAKDHILAVTKGNETNYQSLAANLKSQYDALQADIWRKAAEEAARRAAEAARARAAAPAPATPARTSVTTIAPQYVPAGYVRKGDIIGYQGNSGFSSGTHLHFEVRNAYQAHVNPGSYVGNGYFSNPLPGSRMTQGYGCTTWWAYSFHTGWDLSAGYGAPVRAAADGQIVTRVSGMGNTYPYRLDYGNYVIIRHTNGMYSLYGHLR